MSATTLDRDARDQLSDGDTPPVAHVVNKGMASRAYVLGEEITALCGVKFIPSRDPEPLPRCPECVQLAGMLGKAL